MSENKISINTMGNSTEIKLDDMQDGDSISQVMNCGEFHIQISVTKPRIMMDAINRLNRR